MATALLRDHYTGAPSAPALAQRDPWAGSWRGVLTTPQGGDTNVTITLVAYSAGSILRRAASSSSVST